MGELIELPAQPAPIWPHEMSREQLEREWYAQEAALQELERMLDAIRDALWPPGEVAEGALCDDDESRTADDFVQAIASLHELTDRLTEEATR